MLEFIVLVKAELLNRIHSLKKFHWICTTFYEKNKVASYIVPDTNILYPHNL